MPRRMADLSGAVVASMSKPPMAVPEDMPIRRAAAHMQRSMAR